MVSGVLAGAGYYMGTSPLAVNFRPPAERETNPKGNFEDREINAINEALLAPHFRRPPPTRLLRRRYERRHLGPRLRWASALPVGVKIESTPEIDQRIATQVGHRPFCFKDPRFCYTLPAWRPHLEETAFVCVFREPGRTATSIVTEWDRHPARSFPMTYQRALDAWRAMYANVLDVHRHVGDWTFVHYEQVLDGSAIPRLEDALEATVDRDFPEAALKRSADAEHIGEEDARIYERLCRLAGIG